jgi:hypothetical protein
MAANSTPRSRGCARRRRSEPLFRPSEARSPECIIAFSRPGAACADRRHGPAARDSHARQKSCENIFQNHCGLGSALPSNELGRCRVQQGQLSGLQFCVAQTIGSSSALSALRVPYSRRNWIQFKKSSMIIREIIVGLIALGLSGLLTRRDAAADEIGNHPFGEATQMNMIDQIRGIEQTKKAKVALIPVEASFITSLTEGGLWGLGCSYVTDDPSRITSLIDILRDANLRGAEPTEPGWMGEPREGVSLESPNLPIVRFSFTINFNRGGVRGYFFYPPDFANRSYLTAKPSLPNELIAWAVDTGPSFPKNLEPSDLQRRRDFCDSIAQRKK